MRMIPGDPLAQSCRLVRFDTARIERRESAAPVLVVEGRVPEAGMTVVLARRGRPRAAAWFGVEVVGFLGCEAGSEIGEPFSLRMCLSPAPGSLGLEVIGFSRVRRFPLADSGVPVVSDAGHARPSVGG
jgi:hypothetical protein